MGVRGVWINSAGRPARESLRSEIRQVVRRGCLSLALAGLMTIPA